jgi:hypothetical protein
LEENETVVTSHIQFEPILSDEEIADEIIENFQDEFDEMVQESVIKTFDPYSTMQLICKSNEKSDIIDDQFTELTQIIDSNMKKFPNLKAEGFREQKKWLLCVEDELLFSFQKLATMNYEVINKRLEEFFNEKPAARHFLKEIIKIGLSFDISIIEPHVHLRHIQTGLQLVQSVSMYECIVEELMQHSHNIFETLFLVYAQLWSSKYETLRTIYLLLDTRTGMNGFVSTDSGIYKNTRENFNGYKHLLCIIENNPNKRIMCFLKAIVKKVNLYECLENITEKVETMCTRKFDDQVKMETMLQEIHKAMTKEELNYFQLDRFLPVTALFSVGKDEKAVIHFRRGLFMHFKIHCYLESLLALLNSRSKVHAFLTNIVLINVRDFLSIPEGIEYLARHIDTANFMIKSLLKKETKTPDDDLLDAADDVFHELGNEIFYKIQTECHILTIIDRNAKSLDIVENLHSLYSLTCGPGKFYVVEVLTMANRLEILFELIEQEKKNAQNYVAPSIKCKSPSLSYLIDLIDIVVRFGTNINYLERFGVKLLLLVKHHDQYDSSASGKFNNVLIFFIFVNI